MSAVAYVCGVHTRADAVREVLLCLAVVRCPYCFRLHLHPWPSRGSRYERTPICGSPAGYVVVTTPRTARQHRALTRPEYPEPFDYDEINPTTERNHA